MKPYPGEIPTPIATTQKRESIRCLNLQNGTCVARRECKSILFYTTKSIDPLVREGRRIALHIVMKGATHERSDGTCGATSQEEARRCEGFMPFLSDIQQIY